MKCRFCGLPMEANEEIVLFAPFVANRRDPLFVISDGVFHRNCFKRHPLANQAIQRQENVLKLGGYERLRCIVCNERITNPDDYFCVGFLTDDIGKPIFKFNYLQFHLSHFTMWADAAEFQRLVTEFLSSDAWEGPQLKFAPLPIWYSPPKLTAG